MLRSQQNDRAVGAVLGMAVGDALGAGYEFQSRVPYTQPIEMRAATFRKGEWTDDTAMAVCMLEVTAQGKSLDDERSLDEVVTNWVSWAQVSPDVGIQTSNVLSQVSSRPTADAARRVARDLHERTGKTAGNGSLMRTAPIVLQYLDDRQALRDAVIRVSELTHFDPLAGEACVLWCEAIRQSIMFETKASPIVGIDLLEESRQDMWRGFIAEAEDKAMWQFEKNGFVVTAFQAAWSAITHTEIPPHRPDLGLFEALHFEHALERAVRCGNDTDTVAAIAGMLLGSWWGQSAIPGKWITQIHGYNNYTAQDLVRLGALTMKKGLDDNSGWPSCDRVSQPDFYHPDGVGRLGIAPKLLLSGQQRLWDGSIDFDAVVSLSRIGSNESPVELPNQFTVRVIDDNDMNMNLDFSYFDVSRTLHRWIEEEGKSVLLHCVAAHNRTPSFAMAYLMYFHEYSFERAYDEVVRALPMARPNGELQERVRAIDSAHVLCLGQRNPHTSYFQPESKDALYVVHEAETFRRVGGTWIEDVLPSDTPTVDGDAALLISNHDEFENVRVSKRES